MPTLTANLLARRIAARWAQLEKTGKVMVEVDLIFDVERSKQKFRNYHNYVRNKRLKNYPILLISTIGLSIFILGILYNIDLLYGIGGTFLIILSICLIGYWLKFEILTQRVSNQLKRYDFESERSFKYKFDEEKIIYESKNNLRETKWNLIKYYEINGSDMYLFFERLQLYDIISEEVIGKENFQKMKEIAKRKVQK